MPVVFGIADFLGRGISGIGEAEARLLRFEEKEKTDGCPPISIFLFFPGNGALNFWLGS